MDLFEEHKALQTRRHFFGRAANGIGAAALASVMNPRLFANPSTTAKQNAGGAPLLGGLTHFDPAAKRVIYLFMAGAPSQIDLFDHKPSLGKYFDKDLPDSVRMGPRLTTMTSKQKRFPIAPTIFKFKQYGAAGAWFSELLPHTVAVADDLSIIKTVHTEAINHDPALTYIQTGSQKPERPSLGAWLSYGLGDSNENLPGFVVLTASWTGLE